MRNSLLLVVLVGSSIAPAAHAAARSSSLRSAQDVLASGAGSVYDGSGERSASGLDAGLAVSGVYTESAARLEKADATVSKLRSSKISSTLRFGRAGRRKSGGGFLKGLAYAVLGVLALAGCAAVGALVACAALGVAAVAIGPMLTGASFVVAAKVGAVVGALVGLGCAASAVTQGENPLDF